VRVRAPLAATVVVVLAALPLVLSVQHTARFSEVGAYAVAIAGLGVLVRDAGRVSFGHGALMAVGGYTSALLAAREGLSPYVTLPMAAGAGAVAALVAAVPVLRLPGRYYALPTLGLALALPEVAGRYGAVVLPRLPGVETLYAAAWGLAAAALAGTLLVRRSAARVPATAIAWSGLCAGVAGGLVVLQAGSAEAGHFPLRLSLLLVAAGAIGLYGSAVGALLGALALEYVPDLVALERHGRGPATFVFGAALVLLMLFSPLATGVAKRLRR